MEKSKIIEAFGAPTIRHLEYECGFYSNDQPGAPFYQLIYDGFNYIGSDKEKFVLEEVRFDPEGTLTMVYDGVTLNGRTTEAAFVKLIGDHIQDRFEKQEDQRGILLLSRDSDDGVRFVFKNGKLEKFEYWSPC